jgi:hypothetical protein
LPASLPFFRWNQNAYTTNFETLAAPTHNFNVRTTSAHAQTQRTATHHCTFRTPSMYGFQHLVVIHSQHGPLILAVPASFGHGHFAMGSLLMGIDPASSFSERRVSVSSGSYTDLGIRTLYHATNSSAAHSILSHGFRCGSSGCVGPGIYFADTPSAARHKSRNGTDVVLQADVHLGCAYTIRNGVSRGDERSVDRSESVYLPNGAGGGGADPEYAVFDASRVLNVCRH